MLIKTEDHDVAAQLTARVEEINNKPGGVWGVLLIDRSRLEKISNEKFIIFIKPALEDAASAQVFFGDNDAIYILWSGVQKAVRQALTNVITQSLLRANVEAEGAIHYYDPKFQGDELIILLKRKSESASPPASPVRSEKTDILPPPNEIELQEFRVQQQQQSRRTILKVLIVEDQLFSRQLLFAILRGAYMTEAAAGLKDTWKLFLQHAPDIVFLDIELADGNGHVLAEKIKTLSPLTYVVMVTANHGLDDVQRAQQNHVDGFVAKPFSNQKIQACLDKYLANHPVFSAKGKRP